MINKHRIWVIRSPNHKKIYIEHFRATNRNFLVLRLFEGECRGHFRYVFLNLLGSNVYSWFTKLLQINHIIVSIFSGVIKVTVNFKKWRTNWIWRSNKCNFFPMTLEISFWNKILQRPKIVLWCVINQKIYGDLFTFWRPFYVLFIWRFRSSNIEYYSTDSNSATPKLCKNKWIANNTLKCRANFNVSDFSPDLAHYCFLSLSMIFL